MHILRCSPLLAGFAFGCCRAPCLYPHQWCPHRGWPPLPSPGSVACTLAVGSVNTAPGVSFLGTPPLSLHLCHCRRTWGLCSGTRFQREQPRKGKIKSDCPGQNVANIISEQGPCQQWRVTLTAGSLDLPAWEGHLSRRPPCRNPQPWSNHEKNNKQIQLRDVLPDQPSEQGYKKQNLGSCHSQGAEETRRPNVMRGPG